MNHYKGSNLNNYSKTSFKLSKYYSDLEQYEQNLQKNKRSKLITKDDYRNKDNQNKFKNLSYLNHHRQSKQHNDKNGHPKKDKLTLSTEIQKKKPIHLQYRQSMQLSENIVSNKKGGDISQLSIDRRDNQEQFDSEQANSVANMFNQIILEIDDWEKIQEKKDEKTQISQKANLSQGYESFKKQKVQIKCESDKDIDKILQILKQRNKVYQKTNQITQKYMQQNTDKNTKKIVKMNTNKIVRQMFEKADMYDEIIKLFHSRYELRSKKDNFTKRNHGFIKNGVAQNKIKR